MQKSRTQNLTASLGATTAIAWLFLVTPGCTESGDSQPRGTNVFSSGQANSDGEFPLRRGSQAPAPVGDAVGVAPESGPIVAGGERSLREPPAAGELRPAQDGERRIKRTTEQELLLRSARNAIALEQVDEASDLFESYLLQVPSDQDVRAEYAGVLVRKGRLGSARDLYLATLEALPRSTEIRHRLVDVLVMSGEYGAATTHLEQIVRLNPNDLKAAAMLCRTYSWVKDLERAKTVFDRYLRKLDPAKDADQQLLAPALLDMQKPREALPHLVTLHTKSPRELEWATSLVYCYELLGDAERAARAVDSMAKLEPTVTDSRIRLVDQLLALNNYKLARQVNNQILQVAPKHVMARLMEARILLESYDVRRAQDALRALNDELGTTRRFSLAKAQLNQLIGQWVASQSIYESLLMERPNDDEVRINLALLLREKGDLHRARAELNKVDAESPYGARAQLESASTLILQGSPGRAAGLCAAVADKRPNDVAPLIGLVRAHLAMKHWGEAQSLCQDFIDKHPSDKMAIAQVRVVLGKALLLEGNTVQAARTFQLAMREPSMHEPEAFYGLAQARAKGNSTVSGEIARLSSNIATSGEGIRMRIELGKLALGDQDYRTASQYLTKALRWQPNNIAAMVLLGEAYNLSLKAGDSVDPVKVFAAVLERDAGNTRARLGLARSYAIQRKFDLAVPEYERVLEQDAGYDYATREFARTLFWDQRYDQSFGTYEGLLERLPQDGMAVDFFDHAVDGVGLRALSDFEADAEFAESVRLELEAKRNMAWRPAIAENALEHLVVREPANQEALFDLAQLEHRRGLTADAIRHYEDLIQVAGGHQEATTALAGAERQLLPHLNVSANNEQRNGRDGLSYMDESSILADVGFSMGDRDDVLGFGLGRRTYASGDNLVNLRSNVVRVFGSKRVGENTVLDGVAEFPSYDQDNFLKERLYYDAGVTFTSDSETTIKLRLFSQPVVENSETLIRDIHRVGGRIGAQVAVNRRLDVGASGLVAYYSDDNTRLEANVFAAYEITAAPTELRILVKADLLNHSEESVAPVNQNISGLLVPYFAPSGYSVFSAQADWRHQLGEDWFTGADDMFYKVSARFAVDSDSVGYGEFDMGGGYDVTDWLRVEAGFRLLRSSAIDVTAAYGMVTVRWP